MAFTPTTWVDGTTPITATQLNRIETGVNDAHAILPYGGHVSSVGGSIALFGTTGWTPSNISTGRFRVTHGLGFEEYVVVAAAQGGTGGIAHVTASEATYFEVALYSLATGTPVLTNLNCNFILVPFV